LINNIHKKIELLKEQRTSLINQCVTKGLDSNVEMKDSGVEWIGEIPKHWEIIRLGYISNLFVGYPFKSDEFNHDDGIRLVRGENVSEGFFRWGERSRYWKSSIGLEEYLLEENDIVVGMDGSKVGKNVCRINSEDLPMLLVQRICRIRINEENLSKWVYQSLRSLRFQTWVNLSKTDPLVPHITQKNIHDFKIHLPPRNEMELLLKALSTKLRRVDKVLEMEEKRLKLYKQYRESLISSVVTGKVRVTEDMV
jgi:restriction endonuclease S subunit